MTSSAEQPDGPEALAELSRFVSALLRALEALAFFTRYFEPAAFGEVIAAIGTPGEPLRALRARMPLWPADFEPLRGPLVEACDHTLAALDGLSAAADLTDVFRALRGLARAREALWPLSGVLAPVGRAFLDPDRRSDAALLERLSSGARRQDTGLFHLGGAPAARGGCSVFVPEDYNPGRPAPLVMALHGGSGNGRAFLWSWVSAARGAGAIVAAPTAAGETWALMGEDVDTPNLAWILHEVAGRWPVDPSRLLLTGLSDGGTFSLVSGLERGSPFTHLAPVAAAFHPMLAQMADPARLRGLPIFLVHGARDWMFPIDMAREANACLTAAGAAVEFHEIFDLAHAYPAEMNRPILDWLTGA